MNPFETMMTTVTVKPMVRAVRKPRAVEVKPYAGSEEERAVKFAKAEAAYLANERAQKINHVGTLYVNKLWVVRYNAEFAASQKAA